MRTIKNYELVLSGEQDDRLLLTFDWADIPHIPRIATSAVFDSSASNFTITFEDKEHWEEISFLNLPTSLHELVKGFEIIFIVGLSENIEMFSEVSLLIK